MASSGQMSYEINNRTVYLKWIRTNYNNIIPTHIGSQDLSETSYYGVNGTFFITINTDNPSPTRTILWGIGINNGSAIYDYAQGNRYKIDHWFPNGNTPLACGTMVKLSSSVGGVQIFNDKIANFNNYYYNGQRIYQNNVQWAIGGTSLFAERSYTNATQYYNDISSEDAPSPSSITQRTAIAYLGGGLTSENVLLVSVFGDNVTGSNLSDNGAGGVTLYELRTIIKDIWNVPYHAIALDGGGSTQIRYKLNNQTYYQIVNDSNNYATKVKRKVQSMIRVSDM